MTGRAARFNWLRWSAVFLINLLWATTGGASALAERRDFGHSSFVAKSAVPRGFSSTEQFGQAFAELRKSLSSRGIKAGLRGNGRHEIEVVTTSLPAPDSPSSTPRG